MSQKINSNSMRMGISKTWGSLWFTEGKNYTKQVHEDLKIRNVVNEKLALSGVAEIVIKRSAGLVEIEVYVAKPGVAIGRGGAGIDAINAELKKLLKTEVRLKINEVKKPELSATIIANEIVSGLQRRVPPKILALGYIKKARLAGARGVRIWIAGRINGAPQARTIKHSDGPVPLHTLKADIDYAEIPADVLVLGKLGVKVWVYKGDNIEG